MIKRIIACLTICLIIAGFISPVFSHAEPVPIYTPNWSDPGIAEIIDISDLTGWMANGGVFDITDFQDLEEFMGWYFKLRVPVQEEDGNYSFAPYYGFEKSLSYASNLRFNEQSQIRGMISRSYQNKVGYGRRLQEQVDRALLEDGDLSNVLIPIMNESEAAFFVGYNNSALNQYVNSFSSGTPTPDIPSEYSFINDINYVFVNQIDLNLVTLVYNDRVQPLLIDPYPGYCTVYSAQGIGHYSGLNDTYSYYSFLQDQNVTGNVPGRLTFYINGSDSNYSITCTPYRILGNVQNIGQQSNKMWQFEDKVIVAGNGSIVNIPLPSNETLSYCIAYLFTHFANLELYVNGDPWIVSNNDINVTPEFPDAVGGEELEHTTWPIFVPRAPYYIDYPGLLAAFQRAKQTDNQFDYDDLIDSFVDDQRDPVVDPVVDKIPVPIPNPDPVNPEVVPELPDLPLIPPANNPGFNGVSVLAEIINFTNQSLPSALITVFWGIIFGTVILGIIKILHK